MRGSRRVVGSIAVGVLVTAVAVLGIGAVDEGGAPPDEGSPDAAVADAASDVSAAMAPGSAAAQADDGAEGIEVHGSWTLEVRDPDGTLVRRRGFHNDLTTVGADFLALLLTEAGATATGFTIEIAAADGMLCGGTPACFTSTPDISRIDDVIQLSYAFVVDSTNDVTEVRTGVLADGLPSDLYSFTQRTLDSAVPVEAGQQVLVTVDISFS